MWIERRWTLFALGLSVFANIFLLGVVSGHFMMSRGGAGRALRQPPAWIQTRFLAPGEKRAFLSVMRTHHDRIEAKREAVRNARAAAETVITSPVYDQEKVLNALAAIRQASGSAQETTQAAIAEALGALSPEARETLFRSGRPK